jgi:type IV secretory pathway TraG/TraD family ATPase VirD4
MTPQAPGEKKYNLPRFHPETEIRDLGNGQKLCILHATSHIGVLGATGSGKSSGSGQFLALGYLASDAEFGMLILCPKLTDVGQWISWAKQAGREKDVKVFDALGAYRLNFLNWIASFGSEGAGQTLNVVTFFEELITGLEPEKSGNGGENAFFEESLHQLLVADVDLVQLAGYELSIPTLRDIVRSAPISRDQAKDPHWQEQSACWFFLEKARLRCENADSEMQADYAECRAYWLDDFANLSEKTRSIITLMFTKIAQFFTTRPLRKLFCTDTTLRPEDTFDGAVIIVALPTQEFRTVGKICALVWKYCWQLAVMRRKPAPQGEYLRPVCCWADEYADTFLSKSDAIFVACARQSAGCMVCLTQNISQYRKRLGEDGFESFISNLQTLFVHQSTGPTCRWMSERLGERWMRISGINVGQSGRDGLTTQATASSGLNLSEQRRFLVEPHVFTTLKRGGPPHFEVEAICYMGGHIFDNGLPYKQLLFRQQR